MATSIETVGQYTMDAFYQDFKQNSEFFDLPDFIFHAGATLGDYYRQQFEAKYAELRQEKSEEIVTFSDDILANAVVKVKDNVALFDKKIMSFAYDRQNAGIADVFITKPEGFTSMERTNLAQIWQLRYMPYTGKIFWYLERGKIKFYSNGTCNVNEVSIYYVPGVGPEMEVADSLIDWTVNNTVQKMRQLKEGVIVKKSLDGNQNKLPETEIDKSQLK
jgi:hypothetical protein